MTQCLKPNFSIAMQSTCVGFGIVHSAQDLVLRKGTPFQEHQVGVVLFQKDSDLGSYARTKMRNCATL